MRQDIRDHIRKNYNFETRNEPQPATPRRRSTQKCTLCDEPSIPGLVKGKGKCQYHWNVGAFGREWADHVKHLDEKRDDPTCQTCKTNAAARV